MEILYKKIGNRYVPVGVNDIPHVDGVYVVHTSKRARTSAYIGKLCNIEDVPLAGALLSKTDVAAGALVKARSENPQGLSAWETARIVLETAAGIKKGECE